MTWTAAFVLCALAAEPAWELELLAGDVLRGTPRSVTDQRIALTTPVGVEVRELRDVATLRAPRQSLAGVLPGARIELVDGSIVPIEDFCVQGGTATCVLADGQRQELPLSAIARVILEGLSAEQLAELDRLLTAPHTGDLVVVRKREALDFIEGTLGDVGEATLQFRVEGETLSVKRPRAVALVYWHSARPMTAAPRAVLHGAGGARLAVAEWSADATTIQLHTPAGLGLTWSWDEVATIEWRSAAGGLLSDLEPRAAEWRPYLPLGSNDPFIATYFRPRWFTAAAPGQLWLGGRSYTQGISLAASSRVVYDLPREYSRLLALVGIDDQYRPAGRMRLVIRSPDRVLFETDIDGRQPPKCIEVDLRGAKQLILVAEFAVGGGPSGNGLHLVNARLIE